MLRRSVAEARADGSPYRITWNVMSLGWSLGIEGRLEEALRCFAEAKEANPAWREGNVLELESHVRWLAGDLAGALRCTQESLTQSLGTSSRRRGVGMFDRRPGHGRDRRDRRGPPPCRLGPPGLRRLLLVHGHRHRPPRLRPPGPGRGAARRRPGAARAGPPRGWWPWAPPPWPRRSSSTSSRCAWRRAIRPRPRRPSNSSSASPRRSTATSTGRWPTSGRAQLRARDRRRRRRRRRPPGRPWRCSTAPATTSCSAGPSTSSVGRPTTGPRPSTPWSGR